MCTVTDSDEEREANIARNRELIAQLGISAASLDIPSPTKHNKLQAKPVQPRKKVKRESTSPIPRATRQSARLRKPVIDPNETPTMKRKREVCTFILSYVCLI